MTNTEIFLAVVAGVVFTNLVITFVQLSNLEKKYRYLKDRIDDRVSDCAKRWDIEDTNRKAKNMQDHIDAIERHLGIVMVEEPARLMVKTGESK